MLKKPGFLIGKGPPKMGFLKKAPFKGVPHKGVPFGGAPKPKFQPRFQAKPFKEPPYPPGDVEDQNLPIVTPEFKDFVLKILKERGRMTEKGLITLSQPVVLENYRIAFVDDEYNSLRNYETYEYIGDKVIGSCIVQYFRERFPNIVNVNWLTKMHHYVTSNDVLGLQAYKYGFGKFAKYGRSVEESITKGKEKNITLEENDYYINFMGDIFEAFMGCTVEMLNKYTSIGIGGAVCYNIVKSFLSEVVTTNYNVLFDAKTRFTENILTGYGWIQREEMKEIKVKHYIREKQNPETYLWEVTVFGVIDGRHIVKNPTKFQAMNFKKNGGLLTRIGFAEAKKQQAAAKEACQNALNYLSSMDNFEVKPPPNKEIPGKVKRRVKKKEEE